jgi:hypothetical protein
MSLSMLSFRHPYVYLNDIALLLSPLKLLTRPSLQMRVPMWYTICSNLVYCFLP